MQEAECRNEFAKASLTWAVAEHVELRARRDRRQQTELQFGTYMMNRRKTRQWTSETEGCFELRSNKEESPYDGTPHQAHCSGELVAW